MNPKNPFLPPGVSASCGLSRLLALGVDIVGNGIGTGFDVSIIAEGVAEPEIAVDD